MTTDTKPIDTPAAEPPPAVGAMTDPESRVDALLTAITVNNLVDELSAWKDAAAAGASEFSRVEKTLTRQRDAARAEVQRMTENLAKVIAELAAYKKQAEEAANLSTSAFTFLSDELDMYKAQAAEDVERIADLRGELDAWKGAAAALREENAKILARLDKSEVTL
jgi:chromosome segregation ATPase